MKPIRYFYIFLMATLVGCSDEVVTDVYLPSYEITTHYSYSFENHHQLSHALDANIDFSPYSLSVDGDTLYIGNRADKSVYSYDLKKNRYLDTFKNADRTDPLSMLTVGNYLFVACGNSREVQIFDKTTTNYVSRLGTGVWTGNVSYATTLAQCHDFIFVRDSKNGVRVFRKNDINYTATNNNSYYANLDCDELITSNVTSYARDMEVLGDSLYLFDATAGRAYIYSLESVRNKQADYARRIDFNKTAVEGIAYVLAMEIDHQHQEVILKLKYDGSICYAYYSMDKFAALDWDNPDKLIKSEGRNSFAELGDFVRCGTTNIYTTADAVKFDQLKADSIIIHHPLH